MALEIGAKPFSFTLNLTVGGDFVRYLDLTEADKVTPVDFLAGETLTLVFKTGPVSWPATIDGNTASWNVQSEVVDALVETMPNSSDRKVKLQYHADPDYDFPLLEGNVRVFRQ